MAITAKERRAIHFQVSLAIQRGELVRSRHCESCGRRTRTQGHHDDYTKPLEVRWLCSSCHVRLHAGLPLLPDKTAALISRDERRGWR